MQSDAATAYQAPSPETQVPRDWESKAEKLRHKTYTLRAVSFHERVKYREINQGGGENAKGQRVVRVGGGEGWHKGEFCVPGFPSSHAPAQRGPPKKRSGVLFTFFQKQNKKTL